MIESLSAAQITNPNNITDLLGARRRAADIARAEATLRAEAAWRDTYSETFARVFDETLAELLAEQQASEAAA
jgi:hypothetical protein